MRTWPRSRGLSADTRYQLLENSASPSGGRATSVAMGVSAAETWAMAGRVSATSWQPVPPTQAQPVGEAVRPHPQQAALADGDLGDALHVGPQLRRAGGPPPGGPGPGGSAGPPRA